MQVASLVFGILGLVAAWIPIVGLVLAAIGSTLGLVSVKQAKAQQQPTGVGTAGLVLSIIGVVAGLLMLSVFIFGDQTTETEPAPASPLPVVVDPYEAVVDGGLEFATVGFSCAPIIDTTNGGCFLEFSVANPSGATEPLPISHQAGALIAPVLAPEDLGPDSDGGVFLDQGSTEYSPNAGSCSVEQVQPAETASCRAFFEVSQSEWSFETVVYRASASSNGARVALPQLGVTDPIDQQVIIDFIDQL